MVVRRRVQIFGLACVVAAFVCAAPVETGAAGDILPARLSDADFWSLSEGLSEPDGTFRSDNLLSNELYYPEVLRPLVERVPPGGVYLGVGPEQNFTYIAATRPRLVFITDVRRGNLHLQLMYKALFELSADRVEFISRLFSKPRPASLPPASSAADIMNAFWTIETSARDTFERNLADVRRLLTTMHRLPLSEADLAGIADVYAAFYWFGPSITYGSTSNGGGRRGMQVNYHDLMVATDDEGVERSFLANEGAFDVVRRLQARNLIVPVVGNFGGARALRGVGRYVRDHGATVSAFYLSNVEQYLRQDGLHAAFCANVASMPLTDASTFIRSQAGGGGFRNLLGAMKAESAACAESARPRFVPVTSLPDPR